MKLLEKFKSWDDFISYHPGLKDLSKHPDKLIVRLNRPSLTDYFRMCGVSEQKKLELCRLYTTKEPDMQEDLAKLLAQWPGRTELPWISISQLMSDTAKEYDAEHHFFNQNQWQLGDAGGVCHALCKMWLKNAENRAFPSNLMTQQERVQKKQTKYSEQNAQGMLSNKLTPCQTLTLKDYEARQQADDFWPDCADAMTPRLFVLKHVGLKSPLGNHAVASCETDDGNCEYFFDPNGGVMAFKDGGMEDWLKDEFVKATACSYDRIFYVEVREFKPKEVKQL